VSLKVLFIGCVEFSRDMLVQTLALESVELVGVVTRAESSFNSDFCGLQSIADSAGVDTLIMAGNEQNEMAHWIAQRKPDIIFCFGWSYLLQKDILNIPAHGVLGYHPAKLPRNRGRHPLIWALALGLSETASTFFIMDEGADSGDIVDQAPVTILPDDDAKSLYSKVTNSAKEQLITIVDRLVGDDFMAVPQIAANATSWRKRGELDGQIDWRMPAQGIYNLVRALTTPYIGAHCVIGDKNAKVWKVKPISIPERDIEPGKVIYIDGNQVTVKCGEDGIVLLDHELPYLPTEGSYI
jgi:methionyl-tRNA formyltransferase